MRASGCDFWNPSLMMGENKRKRLPLLAKQLQPLFHNLLNTN
jgi:hypothetical protein